MAFLPFVKVKLFGRIPKPYPENPRTLGEHLRKRRMERELLQREAAVELGCCHEAYLHWELDQTAPSARVYPAIITFLGYAPWPEPETLAEMLLAHRRIRGWTTRQAAKDFGVDPGTWERWEAGQLPQQRKHWTKLEQISS